MNRLYIILFPLLLQTTLPAQNDTIPPTIFCPPNDTVTLGSGGICTFQYFYAVNSNDNLPGDTLVQLAGLESGADFPLGNTLNVFQAMDAAGNTASCSFTLTVQQYFGALSCKSFVSASVGPDCMWQPDASLLLDGSFGCPGGYLVEVDKDFPYGNGPWTTPAIFDSSDLGKTYVFRVRDSISGNFCVGNIKAEDMLPPVLACDGFAISCAVDDVSPSFLKDSLGIAAAVPTVTDACTPIMNLQHQDAPVSMDCASGLVGVINRKWTAHDGFSNSSTCIQQISLIRPVLADLRFPPDTTFHCVDGAVPTASTGLPYLEFVGRKFTNLCNLGVAANDSTIQISPCSKQVLRTWFAIDWCNGDALDTVQVIGVQDTLGIIFLNCPDSTITLSDTTATNDPLFWNAPYWATPQNSMQNLCEGQADLKSLSSDACSAAAAHVGYLLFLDLDNNGSQETVVDSDNPPAAGMVNFGNAANPNYSGGELRSFDERPVDSILKYRFALQKIAAGDTLTNRVAWNSDSLPLAFETPQLPHGTHKIKWLAQDSCGHESVCEYDFTIKDVRPPTVVCAGTAWEVNLLPTFPSGGSITLYATDFLVNATDNCTPTDLLRFAVRKAGQGTGFPQDTSGQPISHVTFDCLELGPQTVEVWVKDLEGNADFCEFQVIISDSNVDCGGDPGGLDIAGIIKAENLAPVENVTVALHSPTSNMQTQTDQQGQFVFLNSVPTGGDYTLTPTKTNNPLDGVSTFDLLLISKHILALDTLDSPYKLIAADANKNNSITTFDIVELRKLILGIYSVLPNNSSWRFVDKDFSFPDPTNPFLTPFPESISRTNVQINQLEEDFIGIKVGDVNGSTLGDSLFASDDRTRGVLFFKTNDKNVQAGEEFTVRFEASEQVLGWQFTLNLNDLEVLEMLPGEGMSRDNFAVFEDAVTTSVENEASDFAIKFRAHRAGQLSEMLATSSRITKTEAYNPAFEIMDVALLFDNRLISKVGFELYQNQPNPFGERTLIGFHLPEASDATLTIFDQTGRVLHTQSASYPRGYHSIFLEKSLFDGAGVLFYKLETPTDSAVRKMVLLR